MEAKTKKKLSETDINWEITKKLQNSEKFINYIKWIKDNGCIFKSVNNFLENSHLRILFKG